MAVINFSQKYPFSIRYDNLITLPIEFTAKIEHFLNYGDEIG
jgi:hypothetical protein